MHVLRITCIYALPYVHGIFLLCSGEDRLGTVDKLSLLFYNTVQYCN